jgi:hypothetical protein
LFHDVSDDDGIVDGTKSDVIIWNREKATRIVQKMLGRMIIAALTGTLLTISYVGKVKTKWG